MQWPAPLRLLYKLWMKFSHALGFVMSRVILTVLWIIGIGIYAILLKIVRLFKKEKSTGTYWIDVPADREENLKYQF